MVIHIDVVHKGQTLKVSHLDDKVFGLSSRHERSHRYQQDTN